ncbi:MAG TPA: sugar transferase [Gemmatimonadaceae bacterium]
MTERRSPIPPGATARRALDVAGALLGMIVAAPLLAAAAIGIRLSSRGPILYRAPRAGVGGSTFLMYKLRTMHVMTVAGHRITTERDPRVFALGAFLRRTKIDELPQLLNVLRGEMALVGPRPEDPVLVERHYTAWQRETLRVRPGLTSPGSLYYDAGAKRLVEGDDPEERYVRDVLPLKLALDLVYVRRASLAYDLRLIGRTVVFLLGTFAGRQAFPDPPELEEARRILARVGGHTASGNGSAPTAPQAAARSRGVA